MRSDGEEWGWDLITQGRFLGLCIDLVKCPNMVSIEVPAWLLRQGWS